MHLLVLATFFPLPTLTLLGDVPVAPPSPDLVASMPHWVQVLLVVLGAVVPVFSLVSSVLNRYVRAATERGERVPTWLLAIAVPSNVAALNVDKAHQQVGLMKGGES